MFDVRQVARTSAREGGPLVQPDVLAVAALSRRVLESTAHRVGLDRADVDALLAQHLHLEAANPSNLERLFKRVDVLFQACDEAHGELIRHLSEGGNPGMMRGVASVLEAAKGRLAAGLCEALAANEDPKGILRLLYDREDLRPTSAHVSSVLGLQIDSPTSGRQGVSGDGDSALLERGGHMYCPSELFHLREIFRWLRLSPQSTFLDAGSGYGHALFVGAVAHPEAHFHGIEIMPARVKECERIKEKLGLSNVTFEAADITTVSLDMADVVLLFNPFPDQVRARVAAQIDNVAAKKPLTVIDYEQIVTKASSVLTTVHFSEFSNYIVRSSNPAMF